MAVFRTRNKTRGRSVRRRYIPTLASGATALTVQAVPASVTFNTGTNSLAETATTPGATTTFSTGANGAAIAPQSPAAITNFNTGTNSVAVQAQAVPASVTFNTGNDSAQWSAQIPSAARTDFDVGNVNLGGAQFVQGNAASISFSGIGTVAEGLTTPGGTNTFSVPQLSLKEVANPNAASFTASASDSIGEAITTPGGTVTNSGSANNKLSETVTPNPASVTYNSAPSLLWGVQIGTAARVTFSALSEPVVGIGAAAGSFTVSVPGGVTYSYKHDTPGYLRIIIVDSAEIKINIIESSDIELLIPVES